MRLVPVGRTGLLAEVASAQEAVSLYAAARAAHLDVVELVPAARTVLFDGIGDRAGVTDFLDRLDLATDGSTGPGPGRLVELPTRYDGADLGDVARLWDMTTEEVVATHTGTEFVVAFCGFSPGFAYCTGLPEGLVVPRLDTPRPRVPAGSVAVAGEFTGVYPHESPGGWRLLGRTRMTLWDTEAEEPATLAPGTRVRFVAAEQ